MGYGRNMIGFIIFLVVAMVVVAGYFMLRASGSVADDTADGDNERDVDSDHGKSVG